MLSPGDLLRYPFATLAALCSLGCSNAGATLPPPAVVGSDTLTAERLASWLVLGQPLPVTPETATGLANHWVELMVLAEMAPAGIADLQQVERVAWPALRAARVERHFTGWLQSPAPTPEEVEGAYGGEELRLAAHVLRMAAPQAHPQEHDRQREAAARIRLSLTQGTPWEEAVRESEDEGTRGSNGLLGLVRRGDLDPELERVVFALRPGEISPVVSSPTGYHVVYRPRLEDVRPIFTALLQEDRVRGARLRYAEEMTAGLDLRLAADGGERLRSLAKGEVAVSSTTLATWRGGALPDSMALRYLGTLDLEGRGGVAGASDAEAAELLEEMARQEILWERVASETPPLSPSDRDPILSTLQGDLEEIMAAVGSGPGAAERVRSYMDAVIARRREPLRPPSVLVSDRMDSGATAVDPVGVAEAVERARRLLRGAGEGGP